MSGGVMSGADLASQLTVECLLDMWRSIPEPKVGFGYPPETPVLFIKNKSFDYQLAAEGRTQQYAYEKLLQMPQNKKPFVRIPKIYRIIEYSIFGDMEGGEGCLDAFLVMEYVHGKTLHQIMTEDPRDFYERQEEFYGHIATGVSLLLDIPPPNNQMPGPVGGGLIRNPVFADHVRARCLYRSVKEIKDHFNAALAIRYRYHKVVIDLESELRLCACDLYQGNFIFTNPVNPEQGELYLIDFEQTQYLPLSFLTFATHFWGRHAPATTVGKLLPLPTENLEVLMKVGGLFVISNPSLGLEKSKLEEDPYGRDRIEMLSAKYRGTIVPNERES